MLEQENQSSVKLTLTLHDKEGKIEKAGTEYVLAHWIIKFQKVLSYIDGFNPP